MRIDDIELEAVGFIDPFRLAAGIKAGMEERVIELAVVGNGPHHRPEVSGSSYTEGAYTFYRPELTMMVKTVETQFDEWKNVVGWKLDLEEV